MGVPKFILDLRRRIGHDPLWLSGVTAVVVRPGDGPDGDGPDGDRPDGDRAVQVLLVRRADTGAWTPVTGIVDPGEEPADAAVREVAEEAGVRAAPERLALVQVTPPVVYDNGDQAQYLDLVFRMAWLDGSPHPADGENTEAAWFGLDRLPPLDETMRRRVEAALADAPGAAFVVDGTLVEAAPVSRPR